jgi:hypothetical protein
VVDAKSKKLAKLQLKLTKAQEYLFPVVDQVSPAKASPQESLRSILYFKCTLVANDVPKTKLYT